MNFILIMIVLNSSGTTPVAAQHIKFSSHNACLQAMQKLIGLEKNFTVKATCVQEVL